MLTTYIPSERETVTDYELCFDDGHNNGYGFPCDEHGNILETVPEAAKTNKEWCMLHPEKFKRFNKVVKITRTGYTTPVGICECGEQFYLTGGYMGACECPKCKRWYNVFGQELVKPELWEEEL